MKVTIITPTLNEIDGMREVMPRIKPEWYDQLVILDGGSTDGTIDWCKKTGYEIYTQKEKGIWNAYKELFMAGIVKGEAVITFSPDGNSIPELIPFLIEKLEKGYDMVIASRYKEPAISWDDTAVTKFGNHLLTTMVNLLCGGHYTDALVMFRAYKYNIIEKLNFLGEIPLFYKWLSGISCLTSWEPSLSIRCAKNGLKVGEIPGDEPPRISLDGKGRREKIAKHGFIILSQILYEATPRWVQKRLL